MSNKKRKTKEKEEEIPAATTGLIPPEKVPENLPEDPDAIPEKPVQAEDEGEQGTSKQGKTKKEEKEDKKSGTKTREPVKKTKNQDKSSKSGNRTTEASKNQKSSSNIKDAQQQVDEARGELASTDPGTPASKLEKRFEEKADEIGERQNFSQTDLRQQRFYGELADFFEDKAKDQRFNVNLKEDKAEVERVAFQTSEGKTVTRNEALDIIGEKDQQLEKIENQQQAIKEQQALEAPENDLQETILENATGEVEEVEEADITREPFEKKGVLEETVIGLDQSVQRIAKEGQVDFQRNVRQAREEETKDLAVDEDLSKDPALNSNILFTNSGDIAQNPEKEITGDMIEDAANIAGNIFGTVDATLDTTVFDPALDSELFDPAFESGLLPNVDTEEDFDPIENFVERQEKVADRRSAELEAVAENPVDTAKFFGGSVSRFPTASGSVLVSGGEFNPQFNTAKGLATFGSNIQSQAIREPSGLATEALISLPASKAASTASGSLGRVDTSKIKSEAVPTTSRNTEQFGSDVGFADVVDPRTGLGRRPRPGEKTPESLIDRSNRFLSGELGERRMTTEELQELDVVSGENIPDNPEAIPTKEITRTEALTEALTTERKGQTTLQIERPETRSEQIDTTGRDIDSADVTTPEDRRTDVDTETQRKNRGEVGDRPRNVDKEFNEPSVDSGRGFPLFGEDENLSRSEDSGIGLGQDRAVDEDVGEDDFQEFEQDQVLDQEREFNQVFGSNEINREEPFETESEFFRERDRNRKRRRDTDFDFENQESIFLSEDSTAEDSSSQDFQFTPTLGGTLFGETQEVSEEEFEQIQEQSFEGFGQRNPLEVEEFEDDEADRQLRDNLGI